MKLGHVVAVAALAAMPSVAAAQTFDTDLQTLTVTIQSLDALTLSLGAVTPSVIPNGVEQSFSGGTYSLISNAATDARRKIQVAINSIVDADVTVKLNMQAPGGGGNGASTGDVTLGTTALDAITDIFDTNVSGRTITYKITAPSSVHAQTFPAKTVTYTTIAQ